MICGVVLVFDSATSEEFVGLSYHVSRGARSLMNLGVRATPHLTLTHFEVERLELLDQVGANLKGQVTSNICLDLLALSLRPVPVGDLYTPEGGMSISLDAARSDSLLSMRDLTVSIVSSTGIQLIGAASQQYRPHVTLAVTETCPALGGTVVGDQIKRGVTGIPVLAKIGKYGVVMEIVR